MPLNLRAGRVDKIGLGGFLRFFFLATFLISAPVTALASPWYSGCGSGRGATACLNNRERERIARGHTLELIQHDNRTEAVVRDRSGNVVTSPPSGSLQPVAGSTNLFTDSSNPGGGGPDLRPLPNVPPLDRPAESPGNIAIETAAEAEKAAEQQALAQAAEAERKAAEKRHIAEYEKAYAESLARAYDRLQEFVKPREQSADARQRAEAQARLQEIPQLGERFRDMTSAASLPTNAALRARAQDYVVRLDEDSGKQETDAARLEADAARGKLAARQMAAHRETLGRRLANLNSVSSQESAGSLTSQVSGGKAAGAAFGKGPKNGASDISGADEASLRSGRTAGISAGASRSPASTGAVKADTASELIIDPTTGKPAKGESLRELLRRRMAARDKAGGKEAGEVGATAEAAPVKSGFAQFFEGQKSDEPGGKIGDPARDQAGFFLSGPETDQVVARFVGSVGSDGAQAGNEVYGDSTLNIFQRMTSYLRKCQQQKRVGQAGG